MTNFFKKIIATLLLSQLLFPGGVMAFVPPPNDDKPAYVEGEIIVKYKDSYVNFDSPTQVEEFKNVVNDSGRKVDTVFSDENIAVIQEEVWVVEKIFRQASWMPKKDTVPEMINIYKANPNVEFVQPNYIYYPLDDFEPKNDENINNNETNDIKEDVQYDVNQESTNNQKNTENNWVNKSEKNTEEKSEENKVDVIKESPTEEKIAEKKPTEENNETEIKNTDNTKGEDEKEIDTEINTTDLAKIEETEKIEKIENNTKSEKVEKIEKVEKDSNTGESENITIEKKNSQNNQEIDNSNHSEKNTNLPKVSIDFPNQNNTNWVDNPVNDQIFVQNYDNLSINEPTSINFNDQYFKYQWYLKNTWQRMPFGLNSDVLSGTSWVDIGYVKAKWIYKIARERLSPEQKSKKVVVGIMDDFVDFSHPDLDNIKWSKTTCYDASWNIHNNCNWYFDANKNAIVNNWTPIINHWTFIAGIIAANVNNNWITGINTDVEIVSIRILDPELYASTTKNVINAIKFANNNNIQILNYSFWSSILKESEHSIDVAQYEAFNSFRWIIASAAWNVRTSDESSGYDWNLDQTWIYSQPSIFTKWFTVDWKTYGPIKHLMSISNNNSQDRWSWDSYYWKNTIDMFAPGANIVSTISSTSLIDWDNYNSSDKSVIGERYGITSWTSFASPMVAASIAFAKSAYPEKSLTSIRDTIYNTLRKNSDYRNRSYRGWTLDMHAMMRELESQAWYDASLPTWTITPETTEPAYYELKLTLTTNKRNVTVPSPWVKKNDTTYELVVTENGKVSVKLEDEYGQEATVEYTVNNIIERLKADIVPSTTEWTNDTVTLSLNVNVPVADPDGWTKVSDLTYQKIISDNTDISVTVEDSRWTQASADYSVTNIDKTNPTLTINSSDNNKTLSWTTTTVTFSATDDASWVASYKCRDNNESWKTCSSPYSTTLSNEWENIFDIKAIDNAGNESSIQKIVVNRDTTGINIVSVDNQDLWIFIPIKPIKISLSEENFDIQVIGLPPGLSFDKNSLTITWTPNKIGNYPINIKVFDPVGNKTELIFSINISDKTPPTISLNNNNYISENWNIIDLDEQNIWQNIKFNPIKITLSEPSTLTVEWLPEWISFDKKTSTISWIPTQLLQRTIVNIKAIDEAGNFTHIRFPVVVTDKTPPQVKLNWSSYISIDSRENYVDAGVTCTDDVDTECNVEVIGSVNQWSPGTYVITYKASDSSWNITTINRTVYIYYVWPGGPSNDGWPSSLVPDRLLKNNLNKIDNDFNFSENTVLNSASNMLSTDISNIQDESLLKFNKNLSSSILLDSPNVSYDKKIELLQNQASWYIIRIFKTGSDISLNDKETLIQEYIKLINLARKIYEEQNSKNNLHFYILDI